jgi:hypothetical protein
MAPILLLILGQKDFNVKKLPRMLGNNNRGVIRVWATIHLHKPNADIREGVIKISGAQEVLPMAFVRVGAVTDQASDSLDASARACINGFKEVR